MNKFSGITTQDYIINAALPEQTETYTVIPHSFIIDKTREALASKGFEIRQELYRCSKGAQIAQGIYYLEYLGDPELGMMFAWSNSYDKSMKFKCTIGAYVYSSMNALISGNMGSWNRKHTGTADDEALLKIQEQIDNAEVCYAQLVNDMKCMKILTLDPTPRAKMVGEMYFIHELLNSEQMSIVKAEFKKPTFDYKVPAESVWAFYNAVILSLQKSHPKTWMDQQRLLHWYLCSALNIDAAMLANLTPEVEDAAQLTIFQDSAYVEPAEAPQYVGGVDAVSAEPQLTITNATLEVREGDPILLAPKAEKGPLEFCHDENGKLIPCEELKESIAIVDEVVAEANEVEMAQCPDPNSIEKAIDEISVELPEAPVEEIIYEPAEDDAPVVTGNSEEVVWTCVQCGEGQGPDAIYCEGQLCIKCFESHD